MTITGRLRVAFLFLLAALLPGSVRAQPPVVPPAAVQWDYDDVDLAIGPVAVFLVCLDAQTTADCARVPATGGVPALAAGTKTYTWKLPPLLVGPHVVRLQACSADANTCSSGVVAAFALRVLVDPKNLRVTGGR